MSFEGQNIVSYSSGLSEKIRDAIAKSPKWIQRELTRQFQVIDGETGFLVPPLNPSALADKLIAFLKDEKMRKKMGASGRKRVEGLFTIERAAEKTLKLYEALLNL